jgi:hypothetical protein
MCTVDRGSGVEEPGVSVMLKLYRWICDQRRWANQAAPDPKHTHADQGPRSRTRTATVAFYIVGQRYEIWLPHFDVASGCAVFCFHVTRIPSESPSRLAPHTGHVAGASQTDVSQTHTRAWRNVTEKEPFSGENLFFEAIMLGGLRGKKRGTPVGRKF